MHPIMVCRAQLLALAAVAMPWHVHGIFTTAAAGGAPGCEDQRKVLYKPCPNMLPGNGDNRNNHITKIIDVGSGRTDEDGVYRSHHALHDCCIRFSSIIRLLDSCTFIGANIISNY